MYKVVGIDEAGKGPVLGSMFIGFSIITLANGLKDLNDYQKHLKELGVKDSKLLTPKKRNELYQILKDEMSLQYVQLTPAIIDGNFFSGGKLNDLEMRGMAKLLNDLKPDLVIVDALTARPDKFGEQLKGMLDFDCKIISENKADTKYELVGAASICAKELREQEVGEIKKRIGLNCGSGYPADPNTRTFLEENWDNKEFDFIFRKSWKTYSNLVEKNKKPQPTLSDFK
jgi:ribonuclease HII